MKRTKPAGRRGSLAALITFVLAASAVYAPGTAAAPAKGTRPSAQVEKPVPGRPLVPEPVRHLGALPTAAPETAVPALASGSATVAVPQAGAADGTQRRAQASSLPVRIARAAGTALAPDAVTVTVADQQKTDAAGVNGLLLSLTPAAGATGGTVSVDVDTAAIDARYGGDYAARLRLVRLPACALTTPAVPACRVQTPVLGTVRATAAHSLTATVELAATPAVAPAPVAQSSDSAATATTAFAPAAEPTVLAAAAAATGPTGSFTATSLSPSSQWTAGSNSGDFTWTYKLDVPKPFAGQAPAVTLAYDSGAVDGRTDSTNNQTSPVGEGFDLATGGFIERSYKTCSDFTDLPAASQTDDQCWAGQVLNLSLGGKSSALVWDPKTNQVHPADDNGERVELLTDASNGVYHGEYWKVTTTDGTQYYFGRNHGPGYTSQTNTNSAWTLPVYGAHSGDPCNNATFAQASCMQAWRWNLDYVEDTHGNVAMYYYTPETNYYTPDKGQNGATPVSYTRGGVLDHIEYGLRDDNGTVYANPATDKIVFGSTERCIANENNDGFSCDPSLFTAANAGHWHDVPFDQNCGKSSCSNYAPTFWSRRRITSITTQVYYGGGYKNVDTYNLTQSYPDTGDGTPFALALAHIQRCGTDNVTCTPPVSFLGEMKANRVPVAGQDNTYYPAINKWRLEEVDTETGEQIQAAYNTPACSPTNLPSSDSTNTLDCFPEYWTPLGAAKQIESYFYHYTVRQVTETDPTGGSPNKITGYTYLGGAAWHFDDSELAKAAQRTYSSFRGYAHVQTRVFGSPTTLTDTLYLRGMDGDILPSGKRSVTIADTENDDTAVDNDALAGQSFETDVYTADGGTIDHATVTDYTVTGPSATRARTGLNPLQALMTRTTRERTRQALAQPAGTWRRTVTNTAYNSLGLETQHDDQGDGTRPACTRTAYATNAAEWLSLPSQVVSTAEVCPSGAQNGPLLSEVETSYDNQAYQAAPTAGNATSVATASATTGGLAGITAHSTVTTVYDPYGRVSSTTDALNRQSSTSYTPATLGPITQIVSTSLVSTDPLSRSTTQLLDPLRGVTTAKIDEAGLRTEATFDAFGRVTQVWQPNRSKAGGQTPNTVYTYALSNTGPTVVTTQSLADDNSYTVSETLYDAQLRTRQTQADAEGGGRVIEDTVYDSHGWVVKKNHSYFATGAPASTIYSVGDAAVPDQTITTFDGQGRSLKDAEYHYANYTWETDTVYGGDRTTVIPPAGGTPSTTITDARGAKTEIDEFLAPPTVSGSTVTGQINGQGTRYGYDPAGNLAAVTDPSGRDQWTFQYDLRDRKMSQSDPDTGTTNFSYDDAGQLLSTTDARGKTAAYKYDNLGRKIGVYAGTTSGPAIARWTYDTLMKGKVTASAGYTNGLAYISAITGYTSSGQPTGTKVTIPSGEGALYGSYTTSYGYTPNTDKVQTVTEPAAGPFSSETVTTTYTRLGNPSTTQGQNYYVSATDYSPYGEPVQYTQGPSSNPVWQTFTRDDQTHQLTQVRMDQQAAPPGVDKTDYVYNAAGQLIHSTDQQLGGTADTQCYGYDGLGELTQAWTSANTCASNPATSGASSVGGPMPYWTSWSIDTPTGNRLGQTQHALSGGADTVTSYTYNAAGPHLLSGTSTTGPAGTSTTGYQYDASGDTSNRTTPATGAQTLNWDEAGHLTSVTAGTSVTSYVYDAEGNQLMRKDPGKTTLYLGDTELTLNTASGVVSGTRYYKQGGTVVAELPSATGHVIYSLADRQGTSDVTLDSTNATPTFRDYTPYGEVRGTAPANWPGQRGYLGVGTSDDATGLTNLGAREYDPSTGRFISRDPVFSSDDAEAIGGYAYSANDPVDKTDPTGLCWGWAQSACDIVGKGVDKAGSLAGTVVRGTVDAAGVVTDRTSSFATFEWQNIKRDARNPGQFGKDVGSGTFFLEQLSGTEATVFSGGHIYTGGDYCGTTMVCITGVWAGKAAMTNGHTVRWTPGLDPATRPDLVAHEAQHVMDIESVGGALFYGTYMADYLRNLAHHDPDPYGDIFWEKRGYYISHHYYDRHARPSPISWSDFENFYSSFFDPSAETADHSSSSSSTGSTGSQVNNSGSGGHKIASLW